MSRARREPRPSQKKRARSTTTKRRSRSTMSKKPKAAAPLSNKAVDALYGIAEEIYEELDGGQIPTTKIPLRTKANNRFDSKHAVWKYGSLMGVRSAEKVKGALMLLGTMHLLDFIPNMIRHGKQSTL